MRRKVPGLDNPDVARGQNYNIRRGGVHRLVVQVASRPNREAMWGNKYTPTNPKGRYRRLMSRENSCGRKRRQL